LELAQGINTNTKRNLWSNPLFPCPFKMLSLENAVPDTLEVLELEEFLEYSIREVHPDILYHVTFQEIRNGNNKVVLSVEYTVQDTDLLDDESWEEEVEIHMIERHGIGRAMCQVLLELLAITIDEDYFDSDEEEDSDDDTVSIASQPLTPPPSRARRG